MNTLLSLAKDRIQVFDERPKDIRHEFAGKHEVLLHLTSLNNMITNISMTIYRYVVDGYDLQLDWLV